MTKAQALYQFFNSFGVSAYLSTRVPDGVTFPYITYEPTLATHGNVANPRVCIWDYGDSESTINSLAESIIESIGEGHSIKVEGGNLVIYFPGTWQGLTDQASEKISGRFTNLSIAFNTY